MNNLVNLQALSMVMDIQEDTPVIIWETKDAEFKNTKNFKEIASLVGVDEFVAFGNKYYDRDVCSMQLMPDGTIIIVIVK